MVGQNKNDDDGPISTNPDGSKTVRLSEPLKVAGQTVHELTVQKPKAKHLELLDGIRLAASEKGLEFDKVGSVILGLTQALCNLTPKEAGEIPLTDLGNLVAAVAGFFGLADLIGKMPSRP